MGRRRKDESHDQIAQIFGQQLRALRKAKGWTQAQLAQRLSIHGTIVGYYERGVHYPPLPVLKQLADILGVSVDELIGNRPAIPERFQDPELLQVFLRADKLDHKTRSTIKDVLEGVLMKAESEHRARQSSCSFRQADDPARVPGD